MTRTKDATVVVENDKRYIEYHGQWYCSEEKDNFSRGFYIQEVKAPECSEHKKKIELSQLYFHEIKYILKETDVEKILHTVYEEKIANFIIGIKNKNIYFSEGDIDVYVQILRECGEFEIKQSHFEYKTDEYWGDAFASISIVIKNETGKMFKVIIDDDRRTYLPEGSIFPIYEY